MERHPDTPHGDATRRVPFQPDFLERGDGKLDDPDVHHDHFFPTDAVGEIDDLRVTLGQFVDLCQITVGKVVAFYDDLVADNGRFCIRDGSKKCSDLPGDPRDIARHDVDLDAAAASIARPDMQGGDADFVGDEQDFPVVQHRGGKRLSIADGKASRIGLGDDARLAHEHFDFTGEA